MRALHYIVLSASLPLKKSEKLSTSVTGDITPKVPIKTFAYNSAYVQTETLNFVFVRQAVIVYDDADTSAFTIRKIWFAFYPLHDLHICSSASYTSPLLHCAAERPFCVYQLLHFCQLLSNPSINLELQFIFGKPMKRRFQRCIFHMEVLSTFQV